MASHLRYDGLKLRDGIEGSDRDRRARRFRCTCFHIKVTARRMSAAMKEVIELVEAARARGVARHRRSNSLRASSTSLTATIPPWALDGGNRQVTRALEGLRGSARASQGDGEPNPSWERRYQSAGHRQNVPSAANRADPGRATAGQLSRIESTKAARRGLGQTVRQVSVRLRVSSADRRTRFGRSALLHHRRGRSRARDQQPWVAIGSTALVARPPTDRCAPASRHPRNFRHLPRACSAVTCAR